MPCVSREPEELHTACCKPELQGDQSKATAPSEGQEKGRG